MTTPGLERAIARLLGVEDPAALVDALAGAGRLGDGVAVPLFVAASRDGSDHVHAAAAMARGELRLPQDWSGYEARVAGDEAVGVAGAAIRRLVAADVRRHGVRLVRLGDSLAEVATAAALSADARVLVVAEPADPDAGWLAEAAFGDRLLAHLGVALDRVGTASDDVGHRQAVARTADHLDPVTAVVAGS